MPFDGLFSPLHWLIIGVVALVVLGPKEIPQAAREFGKMMKFVRDARSTLTDEVGRFLDGEPNHPDRDPDAPPTEDGS